ncbi:glycosyltransferase family 9 protein [Sphaerisporangium rubeum]|uniref:ADP-heptose:LPS heptosyltransferase n=1 Tax=Sphaerisporangium rubeum TaxID=321317 RepID=A0A7X0IBZ6_9ACTN|nr:ADP-heptose:LPS heptosyltransferase [Sphaerisporangium rubeum]
MTRGSPADPVGTVLVARLDNAGDVLLAGPAIRAVAARAARVVALTGPNGTAAAGLLPGVDQVIEWRAPWIDPDPVPLTPRHTDDLLSMVRDVAPDLAVILTSFHQSSLPLALLLRLAGVPRIAAVSEDYPGSLLDVRHLVDETADVPEALRMLALVRDAGFELPAGDDGALDVRRPLPPVEHLTGPPGYVVAHPGTSAPARAWPADHHARAVRDLVLGGLRVVVTGDPDEQALTARVAGAYGMDLGGVTTLHELAAVLAGAAAVVVANTGPAHLAAAVGTPVVSLFAPVVPAARWAPYQVPVTLLGDQDAPCRGTRVRVCPVAGHPCLSSVTPERVVAAVRELIAVSTPGALRHATAPALVDADDADDAAEALREGVR